MLCMCVSSVSARVLYIMFKFCICRRYVYVCYVCMCVTYVCVCVLCTRVMLCTLCFVFNICLLFCTRVCMFGMCVRNESMYLCICVMYVGHARMLCMRGMHVCICVMCFVVFV